MRILIVFAVLFSFGCATVSTPEVVVVNPNKSDVSPTLSQGSDKLTIKRKVAIGRFSNESKYGQSIFINDDTKDRLGKQAEDILAAKLVQTGKFTMLERTEIDKIEKELSIGNKGKNKNMADFLIVGSITEFGRKEVGEAGVFSRTKRQVAFAKVHIRLIDVATGELVYAEEGTGEAFNETGNVMGYGSRAGYDTTLNDKAIDAAITNLSSNIIENLLESPWRSYILSNEDGVYIISGGKSQNINFGDVFDIYVAGKSVFNKQTGTDINLPGKKVGTLKVSSSYGEGSSEVSFCELISGNIEAGTNLDNLYIQEAGR